MSDNSEQKAITEINSSLDLKQLDELRVKYLGRKGIMTELLKSLPQLPPEERPKAGQQINLLKNKIDQLIKEKATQFQIKDEDTKLKSDAIDVTLPGRCIPIGKLHPITQICEEVKTIFKRLGYSIAEGPDVETDYYNFEALNIPKDHPSRDMWSTFYLSDNLLLRTHTSPVQIRVMENQKPPLQIIAPGKVYRCDADLTHSPVFHQVEGFLVDKNVTFGDLKGTLTKFLHECFGKERNVRFRPSFFPFTEPSAEVDVECIMCKGQGCRLCKQTGWLEILGAGMIDPNVFQAVKIDPEKWSGFAFGMGIERIAMLKYGIDDIRLFFENDLRFLRQF